ncbi:phosphoglycolate phosphatase [Methanobrevibacter sp. DSM 116169]|uniref:phosphoglycolate phosphatase n=1 Tax=Methanobrevibacter sp. DSM 116169 TaxID=3242727 RepID=UPI0038FC8EEB
MSKIKAVAVDVDGTITDYSRKICISALEALRACESENIPVTIVTGNVVNYAYATSVLIGCSGGLVAENGGVIFQEGENNNEVVTLGNRKYIDLADQHIQEKIPNTVKYSNDNDYRLTEIVYYKTIEKETLINALKDFKYLDKINIYDSGFALHITNKNINKGSSLEILCKNNDIKMSEVLAIGDSENDEEFLAVAGLKVAVGNSEEKLKSISDYVCQKNFGDGVKEAIDKFVLDK